MKDQNKFIGAIVFIVVFVGYAFYDYDQNLSNEEPEKYEATEGEAFRMCKKFVKSRLKAPGSATFAKYYELDNPASGYGDKFTVNAWVDAENAFGAKLRKRYLCKVTHTGGGTYNLTKLEFK